jgi:hypothetical protein
MVERLANWLGRLAQAHGKPPPCAAREQLATALTDFSGSACRGAPTPRGRGGEGRGAARRAPSVAPRHRRAYDARAGLLYAPARALGSSVAGVDGGGGVGGSFPAAREVGVEARAEHLAVLGAGPVGVAHAGRRGGVALGLARGARGEAGLAVDGATARPQAEAHQVAAVAGARRCGGVRGAAAGGGPGPSPIATSTPNKEGIIGMSLSE